MCSSAHPDPVTWLDKALAIDPRVVSEHIRLTLEGDNEEELLVLLNAVAKSYEIVAVEWDNRARLVRQKELETAYDGAKKEMDHARQQQTKIAKKLGATDALSLAMLDSDRREELRRENTRLSSLELERILLETIIENEKKLAYRIPALAVADRIPALAIVEALLAALFPDANRPLLPPIPWSVIEEALLHDPGMQALEEVASKARRDLARAEILVGPGGPSLIKYRADLKAAEEARDQFREKARVVIEARLREKAGPGGEARANIAEYNRKQIEIRQLKDRISEIEKKIEASNDYKIELETLKVDSAQKESLTVALAAEIGKMKVELNAPPRVKISEDPFIVPGIEGSRRMKFAILAAAVTFFVGIVGLVTWEYRGRRVTHATEVIERPWDSPDRDHPTTRGDFLGSDDWRRTTKFSLKRSIPRGSC